MSKSEKKNENLKDKNSFIDQLIKKTCKNNSPVCKSIFNLGNGKISFVQVCNDLTLKGSNCFKT